MLRKMLTAAMVAAVLVTAAACSKEEPKPDGALKAFAEAWAKGDLAGQRLLGLDGAPLAGDAAQTALKDLEGDLGARRPKVTVKASTVRKSEATAGATVDWPLADGVTWSYETTIGAQRQGDTWLVRFGRSTVHPDLQPTDRLSLQLTSAPRGDMLLGDGQPMVTNRQVVTIGLEPRN